MDRYPVKLEEVIIEGKIFLIRGHKVMLSIDLAELYNVEPKVLTQAVKRNVERFPSDFMFQLTYREFTNLKSQIVTSSWGGIRRAMPYAFTEQGVAMLSGILNSPRAIRVNIEIMRAFVRLRQMLISNAELARKLNALEKKNDAQLKFSAASRRESSILKEQYRSSFARLPRSKLRGMRSLSNSRLSSMQFVS
ncbi:MAG: ORF6N domain-containing protein [Syntrophales bacterium]|jgi:hypothetical protein